ncbi:MAG: hypothetical protein HDR09_22115 [Lachnospiraceae bacterium]|nr:hypothetical protein [Lachnospiraceae bacterium]
MSNSMEQREFLKIIRACRRRMNIADFVKKSVFALSIGAGAGIILQAVAFLVPLYYADLYMVLAFVLAELSAFLVLLVKQTTMEQAALRMDGFGFEERIVTAYEQLDREGTLVRLQREDAMKQLREHRDRIQIPLMPSLKRTALLLMLLVIAVGLSLLPSAAKDRAGELHSIREEAREKEDEIEDFLEALEQLEQEELTEEQQEVLKEMAESLESSLSEYQQAVSEEMLAAASRKLEYKYENMSSQLSDLIQELQNGAGVSIASADAMEELADQLKKMRDERLARGDGAGTGQGGSNGNDQTGQNGGDGDGNGQSGEGDGNGQGGEGDGNGQGGEGDGSGQNGQSGDGNGNGQNGQGEGGSSGSGRGDGSSSTPHDYVSVPNAVADSGNLTGNVGSHETSEFFRAQNGLNWEGEHTSYEAVIGSYEQNAYEGIAADRYPSGMEEIIKEYFASFNN